LDEFFASVMPAQRLPRVVAPEGLN
jgi:hypothetical protein